MTEQDLINQMVSLTGNASAVLSAMNSYVSTNGTITITLSGGTVVSFPSIPAQMAIFNATMTALKAAFTGDFGGIAASQTITRNVAGLITATTITLTSGWIVTQTFTRNAVGKISSIAFTITDNLGALQSSGTKTLTYDASNRFQSLS